MPLSCPCHGCNDWNFPKSWTKDERQEFSRAVFEFCQGEYEDADEDDFRPPADFEVMRFLADHMLSLSEEKK